MRGRTIALGIAGLAALCAGGTVGGGALIDGSVEVETTRTLSAPPEALFPLLSSADGLTRWWSSSPPMEGMPPMTVRHAGGPAEGPGMVAVFEAQGATMETWTLKQAQPPRRVVYEVDFAGMMTVERTLTIAPEGAGSRVDWREAGRISNPVFRWMKVLMPAEDVERNFAVALDLLQRAAAGA